MDTIPVYQIDVTEDGITDELVTEGTRPLFRLFMWVGSKISLSTAALST